MRSDDDIDISSSEEIRQKLRERAKQSTFFMAKAIIGFKDLTVNTHGPMCKFIDGPETRKLGLAPRDHLKTSVWTIANTLVRISRNPNIRILLGNETATNATHFLRRIQAVFERNQIYRWLFPELIPDFNARGTKWSETEMCINRSEDYPEATVEAIGVGGAVVGRHYDLIKLDDLVGKEASESETVMQKTIDWYQYVEPLLDHPVTGEIQNYGTRWGYNDLHRWALENEPPSKTATFFRACYNEDGTSYWPERFDLETLNGIRRKLGSFKFSCQYLNDPKDPDTNSFDIRWLKYYELSGYKCLVPGDNSVDWRGMHRTLRIDPAISDDDQACDSAIVVDGVDRFNRKFLLDVWNERAQPSDLIAKVFELVEHWQIDQVGVESVAFSKIFKFLFEQEMDKRGAFFNVVELRPDTRKSKKARIRGIQPVFERGEFYCRKTQDSFIQQYEEFPTGRLLDVLDAVAYGPQMWELPEEAVDETKEENREYNRHEMWEGRLESTGY